VIVAMGETIVERPMSRLLTGVSVLALFLPQMAGAQDNRAPKDDRGPGRPAAAAPAARPPQGAARPQPGAQPAAPAVRAPQYGGYAPGPHGAGPAVHAPAPPYGGYRQGPGGPGGGVNAPQTGGYRQGPGGPGPGGGRPGNTFAYGGRYHPRYRGGDFRYPEGYGYRRWILGQSLPLLFLSPYYFFNDYSALGLDPPPFGYQWVRYGPDLLLVQIGTGRIVDVVYGAFY
jgi:hypothetical protein